MFWPLQDYIYNPNDTADDPLAFARRKGSQSQIIHIIDNQSTILKSLEDIRKKRVTHYQVRPIGSPDDDDVEGLGTFSGL
jgi:flagellar biosynthesis/type III secretory pathway chaperone